MKTSMALVENRQFDGLPSDGSNKQFGQCVSY